MMVEKYGRNTPVWRYPMPKCQTFRSIPATNYFFHSYRKRHIWLTDTDQLVCVERNYFELQKLIETCCGLQFVRYQLFLEKSCEYAFWKHSLFPYFDSVTHIVKDLDNGPLLCQATVILTAYNACITLVMHTSAKACTQLCVSTLCNHLLTCVTYCVISPT